MLQDRGALPTECDDISRLQPNSTSVSWPKSIGRSKKWPKQKLAEVEMAKLELALFATTHNRTIAQIATIIVTIITFVTTILVSKLSLLLYVQLLLWLIVQK